MECGVCGQPHKTPHFHPRHRHSPLGMTLPRTAWVRLKRLRSSVRRFRSCLYKWGMTSSCGPLVWRRRTNRRPCCPPMSNPSTSSLTARPDGFRQWDNRMAAQHLPRDLVRPSCGLKNSLKRWRKQTQNLNPIRLRLRLQQRKLHSWSFWKHQESASKTSKIQSTHAHCTPLVGMTCFLKKLRTILAKLRNFRV